MVIAVRQALDYKSTGRAIGVCLLGWVVYVAFMFGGMFLLAMFGMAAGGAAGTKGW